MSSIEDVNITVVWHDDPKQLRSFIDYLETIANCECCQNNFQDSEHYHNDVCAPEYVERPDHVLYP